MTTSAHLVLVLLLSKDAAGPLAAELTSRGATVQFQPGEIVAVWPAAGGFEVAAIRAARAALREDVASRAGLHAGGPDPETAARALARFAPDGAVLVSKAVERLIPRRFQFDELPVLEVGSEAVPAYRVLEEIGSPGEFGEAVSEDVTRLASSRNGGAKRLIVGPPGSGRATALRAVRLSALRHPKRAAWIACGRCSRRPPSPFGGIGGILLAEASASGFDRWDGERVVAAVRRLGGSAADADTIALSLGLRLNATTDPPAPEAAAAQDAWKRFLEATAPAGTLLHLEDLDQAAHEELALLESISNPDIGIMATASPGTPVPKGFAAFELASFPAESARALMERGHLPADLPAAARLNPLLLCELSLLGEATAGTPRAAIEARFKVLPADVQEALAAAAVLGRSFWRFTLERVLGFDVEEALSVARQRSWLLEREGSLMGADGELLFRHALHRDVAEASLATEVRRRLHAIAAGTYEQRARTAGPAAAARAAWHRNETTL